MKTCNRCKTEKPFSEFHKDASVNDGYQRACKQCKSVLKADWYLSNRERILADKKSDPCQPKISRIDRANLRLEAVRALLGSLVPSDEELDAAIDAAIRSNRS